MKLFGDTGTVRVRLDGDRVTVALEDGTRRQWRDLMAIVVEEGKRKIVAVGETEKELRRGSTAAEQRMLDGVQFVRALAPQGFEHEVAHGYLAYVVHATRRKVSWWKLVRKPRLELELPSYAAVPNARQLAFEDSIRVWGHPALVNGARARPLSPWLERAPWAATLLMALGVVAYKMASISREHRGSWLAAVTVSLGAALLVTWWQDHTRKSRLREAGSAR